MTDPELEAPPEPAEFALTPILAELWRTRQRLVAEVAEREQQLKEIDQMFKDAAPDEAEVRATIDGRQVFTYNYTNSYREAAFRDDYPHLWRQYAKPTLKHVMDWTQLREEHPALAGKYQSRSLRPTSAKGAR